MKRFLLVMAVMAGCSQKAPATPAASTSATPATQANIAAAQGLPPGHPAVPAGASPATGAAPMTGKVTETMDSGGYTYLHLESAEGTAWVAVPPMKVKVGDTVTVNPEMTMHKFESTTLHRTFDEIVFASIPGTAPAPTPGLAPSMAPAAVTPATATGQIEGAAAHMQAPALATNVKIARAEGADGKTVAEIWSGKQALADKNVVVRGKVVKALGGIMGLNWIHIQDGSGTRAKGDDDITVTSTESAVVGDTVLVRGVVHVDKDFGAGYQYPVIIEKASLTK